MPHTKILFIFFFRYGKKLPTCFVDWRIKEVRNIRPVLVEQGEVLGQCRTHAAALLPIIADEWSDVSVPFSSQLKSPFSSMLVRGWRSVELQITSGASIDNQQANLEIRFWPGEGEEPLSSPNARPLGWVQVEMSASRSWACGRSTRHCLLLKGKEKEKKNQRIEPLPPLCK